MPELEWVRRARSFGPRVAVTSDGHDHSYDSLLSVSEAIAASLLDGSTDLDEQRIAFLIPASFDYVAVQWGIWRAGGIAVPLSLSAADPGDVIRPIDEPKLETVAEASQWLDDREPVVLVEAGGETRAYPLRILTWHEIVNDVLGGVPVAVTYCPLCNSAVGFEREVEGQVLTFGVSGLLRNSDLVMWDRQTESLWQQISGEGIVGELAGTQLVFVPATIVSWETFREEFPEGTVLSQDTGFGRSYGINPYSFYDSASRPFLFSGEVDDR